MSLKSSLLVLAIITTGLIAGTFYGFSVAVNPAFRRLSDAAYLAAMQAINDVIQNPVFAFSFFGAPLLLPLTAVLYRRTSPARFRLLAAASVIYLVGSFGVTVGANIPLNETLASFPLLRATAAQAAAARTRFERPWTWWHTVRAVASTIALGLAAGAAAAPGPESVSGKRAAA